MTLLLKNLKWKSHGCFTIAFGISWIRSRFKIEVFPLWKWPPYPDAKKRPCSRKSLQISYMNNTNKLQDFAICSFKWVEGRTKNVNGRTMGTTFVSNEQNELRFGSTIPISAHFRYMHYQDGICFSCMHVHDKREYMVLWSNLTAFPSCDINWYQ